MKTINALRKITIILSVLVAGYVHIFMIDRILTGPLPKHHILIMTGIYSWLAIVYYANFVYKGEHLK